MLAGRKLLLADDSATIQKVVALTFADEGVNVLCVSDGREAIERLAEFAPDFVLADIFMPELNGYEVCEYIKQNDEFKHIPVMLLVGSFEPFDEEEARRVGANDILTKPFQSIRRLIEKVGLLSSNNPPEEEIPTAQLPPAEEDSELPAEHLTTAELEVMTADTRPLPQELSHLVEDTQTSETIAETSEPAPEVQATSHAYEGAGEVLLDLGDFRQGSSALDDDFVLDVDLDEIPEPSPAEPAFLASGFRARQSYRTLPRIQPRYSDDHATTTAVVDEVVEVTPAEVEVQQSFSDASPQSSVSSTQAPAAELSPEMIDAIARRAVEHLSEKVIEEIAWEVVPQLAELMIKRQLEEKNS